MEAKFLTSALSFLSIFLAVYAQSFANDRHKEESMEFAHAMEPVIYYGDSNVNVGQPFEITCVIPITEKVHWTKNGESITRHNLRHGHDEHSYSLSENAIEGESHKIEAQLKVRHALKIQEGRYQCNNNNHRHANGYHMLHVNGKEPSSTESGGYQTIDEMTPSSPNEIFTNTWKDPQQQSHKPHKQHFPFGNATADYGIGYGYDSTSPYGVPAPTDSKYNSDLTTTWHTQQSSPQHGSEVGINRIYSATPPAFPRPRFSLMEHTVAPPETPKIQLYNQTLLPLEDTATDSTSASTLLATAHHRAHHQQQLQQQAQHTLNAYQLPLPPPPQQPLQTLPPLQSTSTATSSHRNEKYQTYSSPQYIPPALGGAVTAGTTATSNNNNNNNYGQLQQKPNEKGPNSLLPHYDSDEHQMVFYTIRSALVLSCEVKNTNSTDPLIWKKKGVNVTDEPSLKNRVKLIDAERKFMIDKAEVSDAGVYSCEFQGVSKNITAIAKVVVRVNAGNGVVEGEKMMLHCIVAGSNPRLSWTFANYTNLETNTSRVLLKEDNGVKNAILTIDNVTLDDKGEYKCVGRNEANDYAENVAASDSATIRVKGKYAAMWPFLGICAEVLILCVIILIYEKRRNKSELEESDTDPQEQKKKRRNYD